MKTLIIISVVIALSYVAGVVWKKRELPCSLSAMVFELKGDAKWLWTIWLWAVTILITPPLLDAMPEDWKFLGFLTIGCLMFVGAMPLIPTESNKAHNILGVTAGILSQLCVLLINPQWLWLWAVWAVVFVIKTLDKSLDEWRWSVFLSECVCYITLVCILIV